MMDANNMMGTDNMSIADAQNAAGGLRPIPAIGQPEIGEAIPESGFGLPEANVIVSWPKNGRETLWVRLDTFKGQNVIDARAWCAGAGGELKPGRGGLSVALRHLPALADAMTTALVTATAHGLLHGQEGDAE